MIRYIAVLFFLTLQFATPGRIIAAKESGERPRIYLEKRVIAEKKGGQIKYFEVYRMEKGDTLWKIFFDKLGGRKEEFGIFVDAFKSANPDIQNPSRIKKKTPVNLPMSVGTLGRKPLVENMFQEGKIFEHTVISGDFLWKIAPGEFRSTRDLLKYVEEVKKLNPFLKNPDLIFPGQKLYLPKYSYFQETEEGVEATLGQEESVAEVIERSKDRDVVSSVGEEVVVGLDSRNMDNGDVRGSSETEDLSAAKPLLDRPAQGEEGSQEVERAYPEKVFEKERAVDGDVDTATITSPLLEETRRPGYQMGIPEFRGLLSDMLSALGEKLISSGEMYVPLDGGGELVLNMEKYPIARFSKGKNIILDPWNSLPIEVERVIRDKWRGYSILRRDGEKDIDDFLEAILRNGGYHSVKDGESTHLVIGEKVSLTINSDLIVLKEKDSLLRGEVNAIKRLRSPSLSSMQSNIYAYCLKAGVVMIPYYVDRTIRDGYVVSYYSESQEDNYSREKVPEKLPDGAKFILDAAGVRSTRSHKISIRGQGGAFTLTIKPDLVFWVGKQPYILDPERFAEPIIDLLKKEGYRIVRVKGNSSFSSLIPRLLKLAGKEYSLYENEVIGGGKNRGYTLRASGFVLGKESTGGERDILFVGGEVDLGLRELLSRDIGIRVVTY